MSRLAAVEVLRRARAKVKKGWTQGELVSGDRVCAIGALAAVLTGDPGETSIPTGRKVVSAFLGMAVDETIEVEETPAARALLAALDRDQLARLGDEDYDEDREDYVRVPARRDEVDIPTWNDHEETTKAEVLRTFDRAIRRLEKKAERDREYRARTR